MRDNHALLALCFVLNIGHELRGLTFKGQQLVVEITNGGIVEEDTRRRAGEILNSNRDTASSRGRCDCHVQKEGARLGTMTQVSIFINFTLVLIIYNISELH